MLAPTLLRSTLPWAAMPEMTAMMIQAMVSSRIAVARIIWPMSRRMTPISISVMATILTDEMESAVPRNSAVTSGLSWVGMTSLGSAKASATPQANGTAMPDSDDEITARVRCRTRARLVSMPVSSSSSRMPICDTASIMVLSVLSSGKIDGPPVRRQQAEHRRPEQDAGQQLAEQGRLADAAHALAQHPADQQEQDQLSGEDRQRMVAQMSSPRLQAPAERGPRQMDGLSRFVLTLQ